MEHAQAVRFQAQKAPQEGKNFLLARFGKPFEVDLSPVEDFLRVGIHPSKVSERDTHYDTG
ncbi:MAG: hypothetical protein A3F68_12675 [Acidobacteria bacterium RIFCSPLOWO2_12_FULL_54_10]|nr:MAG: hypothetical protein A3F68_12675 [Acidobacteria bacterium RIFCSPLOWO2_12_FULL_54_10]